MDNDEIVNNTDWVKNSKIIKDNKAILHISINLDELLNEARAAGRREGLNEKVSENKRITQIFIELGEIHIVNNWTATKDGKG